MKSRLILSPVINRRKSAPLKTELQNERKQEQQQGTHSLAVSGLRRGALLGPPGVVALGTLGCFCLVQQVSAVRLLTAPGLQSWAPCRGDPGENAFSSLHVFLRTPAAKRRERHLPCPGGKLLPGVQWEESALLWLDNVIAHISKFGFIETKVFQNNNFSGLNLY